MWTPNEDRDYHEHRQRESERISNGYRRRGHEDAAAEQNKVTERHRKETEKAREREDK